MVNNRMSNLIIENGLPMTWTLALAGIQLNLMLPEDAISLASNESWENLTADQIAVILEYSEKGKQDFLKFMTTFLGISNDQLKDALDLWACLAISFVVKSDRETDEKLEEIARIWAIWDYPEKWVPFINYMPVKTERTSSADLLENAIRFVESEKAALL
jgi:hypothetical protein